MKYRLTVAADTDLTNVFIEGVRHFGLAQANAYFDRLERALQTIADNPQIARQRTEIEPPVRVHPFGSHVVIYEIDAQGVLILRVRHHLEDWMNDPL